MTPGNANSPVKIKTIASPRVVPCSFCACPSVSLCATVPVMWQASRAFFVNLIKNDTKKGKKNTHLGHRPPLPAVLSPPSVSESFHRWRFTERYQIKRENEIVGETDDICKKNDTTQTQLRGRHAPKQPGRAWPGPEGDSPSGASAQRRRNNRFLCVPGLWPWHFVSTKST